MKSSKNVSLPGGEKLLFWNNGSEFLFMLYLIIVQGFQNKPAAAEAPAGVTRFTAGYFVLVLW